jgi:hypothetical protein
MRDSDRATRVEGIFARRVARAGWDARVERRDDVAERIILSGLLGVATGRDSRD